MCCSEDCTAIFLGKEYVAICNSSLSALIRSFAIQLLATFFMKVSKEMKMDNYLFMGFGGFFLRRALQV